jgi:hypothetical protein
MEVDANYVILGNIINYAICVVPPLDVILDIEMLSQLS